MFDIRQVVVVNESRSIEEPGPIYVFRTASDACSYLEPIDVENAEYQGISGEGRHLIISTDGRRVSIVAVEPPSFDEIVLRRLLESTVSHLHEIGKAKNVRLDGPTESLIAAIGFTK